MSTKGGVYNILHLITDVIYDFESDKFTAKDIQRLADISNQAVTNNLTRLCALGIIKKTETREGNQGRIVKYELVDDQALTEPEKIEVNKITKFLNRRLKELNKEKTKDQLTKLIDGKIEMIEELKKIIS